MNRKDASNRLIYMHPPKCAGTSVVRALRLRYLWKGRGLVAHSMRPVLNNHRPPLEYADYQLLAHEAADAVAAHRITNGIHLVAGHFWYGRYLRLVDPSVHRMTVVRDPIKRFLSHYRYLAWKYGLEESLDQFLDSERAKHIGSIYGFYFANRYPENSGDEDEIVATAVESLRGFSLIGDVTSIPDFLKSAKQLIGGPLIALRSNKTPKNVKPNVASTVTDEQREKITATTSVDRRIYEAVVQFPNYVGDGQPSRSDRRPDEVVARPLTVTST